MGKYDAAAGPVWDNHAESVSHPVRQIFMMGLVWYVAQSAGGRPLRILEVGTWCGLSALTWAEALGRYAPEHGQITCIDPWEPYFDTALNQSIDYQAMQDDLAADGPYENFLHNIQFVPEGVEVVHYRARSDEQLPKLSAASFDIVYLDGDHSYDSVATDIRLACPLVRDGGVICGDDLEEQIDEAGATDQEVRALPEFVKGPGHAEGYHPGVTHAVGEAFGKVSAWSGFWAMQRADDSWMDISLNGMPIETPGHLPEAHQFRLSRAMRRVPGIIQGW